MKSISVSDGTNADQVIQGQGLTIGLDSGSPAVALKKALYDQVVAALGATVPQGSSVPVVNCTLMRDARLTLAMSDTLSITIPVEDFEMNIPQLKTGGNCPVAIISGNYPAGKESRWRTPPPPLLNLVRGLIWAIWARCLDRRSFSAQGLCRVRLGTQEHPRGAGWQLRLQRGGYQRRPSDRACWRVLRTAARPDPRPGCARRPLSRLRTGYSTLGLQVYVKEKNAARAELYARHGNGTNNPVAR